MFGFGTGQNRNERSGRITLSSVRILPAAAALWCRTAGRTMLLQTCPRTQVPRLVRPRAKAALFLLDLLLFVLEILVITSADLAQQNFPSYGSFLRQCTEFAASEGLTIIQFWPTSYGLYYYIPLSLNKKFDSNYFEVITFYT